MNIFKIINQLHCHMNQKIVVKLSLKKKIKYM